MAQPNTVPARVRDLTPEVAKAMDVEDLVVAVALDRSGRPHVFKRADARQDPLPTPATELTSVFTATFVAYKNGECFFYQDTMGNWHKFCF